MIRSLSIKNFKSIKEQKVSFSSLNIIIGANNSGKSNLLDSIFTIYNIFRKNIDEVFGRGPYSYSAYFCKESKFDEGMSFNLIGDLDSFPFEYEIDIMGKRSGNFTSPFISNEKFIYNQRNQIQGSQIYKNDSFIHRASPDDGPEYQFKKQFATNTYQFVPKLIKKDKQIMEFESDYGYIPYLSHDGSNLLDVLYYIRENDIDRFSRIIRECQKFFPKLKNIKISKGSGPNSVIHITMRMGRKDWYFIGPQLSDGFAIILAILTLLSSDKLPNLILFEEIENGLNPASLELILNRMFEVSKDKQVQFFITTHSPVLLQLLRNNPESIIICEQNEEGLSEYSSLKQKLELFKDDFTENDSMYDIWMSGLIGGL